VVEGKSWDEIQAEFPGVPFSSLRGRLSDYRRLKEANAARSEAPPQPNQEPTPRHKVEFTEEGDTAVATSTSTRIRTLEQLLEAAQVDLRVWQVKSYTVNVWEQGANIDGDIQVTPLFQVKAILIPNIEARATNLIEDLRHEMRQFAPRYTIAKPPKTAVTTQDAHLLELNVPDLHFGKWAWDEETGEFYDMTEARRLYEWAIDTLLSRARHEAVEQVLFVMGNDLFNADNIFHTTTKGTPQDMHGTHRQHFRLVRQMMRQTIDRLTAVAPVHVVVMPGNHDRQTTYFLGEALEDWYANCDTVTVDNSPLSRKYYRYGRNLIGFAHGDQMKPGNMPLKMATERPEDWAATQYREWHIGHFHRKREFSFLATDEANGVRVRVLPSLSAADRWHSDNGYDGGVRAAEAYLWHRTQGLVAQYSANVNMEDCDE
jgi:predicted secreted protein